MDLKTRIFIDFWNFQLNWNSRANNAPCDWKALPRVLLDESRKLLETVGTANAVVLDETLVYASVKAGSGDEKLKNWLSTFLDRQPSFRVTIRTRRVRSGAIWCNSCKTNKVVNATWQNHGHELAHACWGSFHLDSVVDRLIRE